MEKVADKNNQKRLKHKVVNCQPAAEVHFSETSGVFDDAITEGEDMAADLAVELLMEEQQLSRKRE